MKNFITKRDGSIEPDTGDDFGHAFSTDPIEGTLMGMSVQDIDPEVLRALADRWAPGTAPATRDDVQAATFGWRSRPLGVMARQRS